MLNKRICYVVLINDNIIELLCCLWSLWNCEDTYVLMIDQKSSHLCRYVCTSLGEKFQNVFCLAGHNGTWGGYSLVDATLQGIFAGLNSSANWHHLCLLSGNHVALQSQRTIHDLLDENKSYLRSQRISMIPRPSDEDFLRYEGIQRRLWGYFEEVTGVKSVLTGIRSQLPNAEFYKGSQWIALSRGVCERLALPNRSELATFFQNSFVSDESFFHTIVRAFEPECDIVSLDTTFHKWKNASAAEMSLADYENAILQPHWFSRKLPRQIGRRYLHAIQRQCKTEDFDEFVSQSGLSVVEREEDVFAIAAPDMEEVAKNSKEPVSNTAWEKVVDTLRLRFGSRVLFSQTSRQPRTCVLSPAEGGNYQGAVVGIVRSSDSNVVWLTIQLITTMFSSEAACRLLSNTALSEMIDRRFDETHLEGGCREFFKRERRTEYVLRMNEISESELRLALGRYSQLLESVWDCLSS
jgi:hypothetical protein